MAKKPTVLLILDGYGLNDKIEGNAVAQAKNQAVFKDNGIGEKSLKDLYANSIKRQHVFDHYFGIDGEKGCSEDELKEYFVDNTARIREVRKNIARIQTIITEKENAEN